MTDAYTPGPWETSAIRPARWHTQVTVYAESDGMRVATVFRADANACLISAAPDLLKALVELNRVANLYDGDNEGDPWGIHHNDLMDAQISAEKAIAKALGD